MQKEVPNCHSTALVEAVEVTIHENIHTISLPTLGHLRSNAVNACKVTKKFFNERSFHDSLHT
jgi:hypothetical protein